jgi:hypothetical protein
MAARAANSKGKGQTAPWIRPATNLAASHLALSAPGSLSTVMPAQRRRIAAETFAPVTLRHIWSALRSACMATPRAIRANRGTRVFLLQ